MEVRLRVDQFPEHRIGGPQELPRFRIGDGDPPGACVTTSAFGSRSARDGICLGFRGLLSSNLW